MEENNKNEFDDIILQKSNKSEKLKKILLRSIILIIVFLVVMIVMKLINDPGEEKALQMPSEPQEQAAYENNFNSLPITDSTKEEDEFEALARKLKEESSLNDTNTTIEEKQEAPSNSVLDQITVEPKEEPAKVEEKQEGIKSIEKSIEKPTQKPSEKPKNNIVEQQKVPEQSNTNELFESIKTPNVQTQLPSGAYIQVFSLNSLDPKSKELNILKENGYDYKIYKTTVNGKELTKVLVGPYKESELKAELEKVRSKIAKGAFTFRVK
ncbi:SPOR domain-containing protein [Campylobacter lari]|nr:SPOR domain-containing protein [Campylobacter lari]EAL0061346.1 SPOR domain-containing protein [Campylobacter lari]ECL4970282.1 SPOR domain-containing protein [Campylobacter lari]EHL5011628.1 SPOR domain-containing protein [Campylobacter lari]